MIKTDFEKYALSRGISTMSLDSLAKANYVNPMILEERQMNVTTMDIYSRMLMDRVLFLNTEVNSTSMNILTAQLLWLDQQGNKPISLYINSGGGSVIDGLQLIDTMNFISSPISTTCLGMAASMGAVILSCGEKGKRFVLPHSRVMVHQVSATAHGTFADMKIEMEQTERCKKDVYNILADNIGKTYDEIEKLCDRNNWFIGKEAVDLGIVDEVIESTKK